MRNRSEHAPLALDGPALVVSPHLDDAVLSAFAFLHRRDTTVLTVFCGMPHDGTSSDWDRKLGHADARDIMRTRLAEDDRALSSLGVPTIRLPLLEHGYRGGELGECDATRLRAAVLDWLDSTDGTGTVLVPVGAGGREHLLYRVRWHARLPLLRVPGGGVPHPDHVDVRNALVPEVRAATAPVILYEELPYRWTGRGDHAVARYTANGLPHPQRFEVDVDVAAKAAAVSLYRSQTPELFRPWVDDIARVLPATERYWLLAPA
jgi:LmbE family N-acetylglucosaminyl deacetylase